MHFKLNRPIILVEIKSKLRKYFSDLVDDVDASYLLMVHITCEIEKKKECFLFLFTNFGKVITHKLSTKNLQQLQGLLLIADI